MGLKGTDLGGGKESGEADGDFSLSPENAVVGSGRSPVYYGEGRGSAKPVHWRTPQSPPSAPDWARSRP